jgi:hypothetical protein
MRSPDDSLPISALGQQPAGPGSEQLLGGWNNHVGPHQPLMAMPPASRRAGEPEAKPDAEQSHPTVSAVPSGPGEDPTEALKRRLEEIRLPADVKAQILAELPPPEERERLFRELQEKGGLSSEQFLASLGLEVEPQP